VSCKALGGLEKRGGGAPEKEKKLAPSMADLKAGGWSKKSGGGDVSRDRVGVKSKEKLKKDTGGEQNPTLFEGGAHLSVGYAVGGKGEIQCRWGGGVLLGGGNFSVPK